MYIMNCIILALRGYWLDHRLGYLFLSYLYRQGAALPRRSRTTLDLVSLLGMPHLIRAILRSFHISYFSADVFLFLPSFWYHAEGTMNEADPRHRITVAFMGPLLLFSNVLPPP